MTRVAIVSMVALSTLVGGGFQPAAQSAGLKSGGYDYPLKSAGRDYQQQPVFRTGIERVRVDVLVTDAGRPVTGLTPDDFEIKDNGTLVQGLEIATTAGSVAVAVALDLSGSVEQQGFDDLVRACQSLVDALEPDDVAWLVTFSDQFALKAGPARDPDVIRRALANLRTGGSTSMWDAMFGSLSLVGGRAGRSLVLMFTDGQDTSSWLDRDRAVETLKRAEVVVSAIRPPYVPDGFNALEEAARTTGGSVMDAQKGVKLQQQFVNLLNEFRLGYVLSYAPTAAASKNGWHRIEVRLKNKKGKVRAREGYYEPGR